MYVLKRWGFKYITVDLFGLKMKMICQLLGRWYSAYTLNNAEIVLIGRKGKYHRESAKAKQIVLSPKTKHSQKPDEVRNRIVELMGNLSRIELFARQKTEGGMYGEMK